MMSKFASFAVSLAMAVVSPVHAAFASDHEFAALEDRIAELEATALRAGNRKLTMHIYGQVNQAVMFWDDGFKSGMRVIDNDTSSSRFGITGQTTSRSNPTVGYRLEEDGRSGRSAQGGQPTLAELIEVRHGRDVGHHPERRREPAAIV